MAQKNARQKKQKPATKRIPVSEMLEKAQTSTRRNANKIADICNDIIAREDEGNAAESAGEQNVTIQPTKEDCIAALRMIEVIATKMRADTGTTDSGYKKKHSPNRRGDDWG